MPRLTRAERFAAYYGSPEIRERIQEERRRRYAEDPQYRQAQIDADKKRRQRRKKSTGAPRGRPPSSVNRPKVITLDGAEVVVVGLGAAAKMVGVSKVAFRGYDDKRVIPRNRMVDELSRRWYPLAFIQWLVPFFNQQSIKRTPLWEVQARVERAWPDATVPKIPEDNP